MTTPGGFRHGGRRDFMLARKEEEEARENSVVNRWNANMRALELLKEIEREGRTATPNEQATLKRFAGFGDTDFNRAFQWTSERDQDRPGLRYVTKEKWAERGDELRNLLDDDEYKSVRQSRNTAFFTNPAIVDSMWDGLQQLGVGNLQTLRVLEPSAGSGRFIERQPIDLRARSQWTAVEKDALTARLLRHSFGDARVHHAPLEETMLPDDFYDVAISNVPFGSQGGLGGGSGVHDADYLRSGKGHMTRSIHNYFFGKALDKVRPGGIVAFVTSHGMMDSPRAESVRATLAEEADLVGAVRLPSGAFPDTKVVTDIVYLRKRLPDEEPGNKDWVTTGKIDLDGTEQTVNRYFLENPERVLGRQATARHGMREAFEYTVVPDSSRPVQDTIQDTTLTALQTAPAMSPPVPVAAPSPSHAPPLVERKRLSAEDAVLMKSLTGVRSLARQQINLESGGAPETEIEANRLKLQEVYLGHATTHGALNSPKNYALMGDDMDRALLFSLENYDKESECWRPADILGGRTISAEGAAPALTGPSDALDYHMQMAGKLDFEAIGSSIGQDANAVRDSLASMKRVYRVPGGDWTVAEDYLSGNVREKLQWAERAAASDPSFQPNVEALREVLPTWVGGEDIDVPLGSPWVPDRYVNQWIRERLGIKGHDLGWGASSDSSFFAYEPDFGRWRQRWLFPKDYQTVNANQEWGTPKVPAQKIIEKMLTGGSLNIGEKMDAEDVRFAQQRARALQEDWSEWLWSDPERTAELERRYNHTFNEYKPRTYQGKQYYPGMSTEWQEQMHPFQREAIQRIVSDGTTLLAHEVGFGKTASMIGSAMERQRMGMTEKPLFVIPKATHAQFQDQFMELYPGARILAPEEGEFNMANRERFLARIATNDWDAVILTGEQFQGIPLSPSREKKWVDSEKAQLQAALETLESDESEERSGTTRSVSQKAVDSALDNLDKKLKDRLEQITHDDAVYFDQLGVDMLYVDEADRYKNLPFRTGMGGRGESIKGMPSGESARAWDMYTKIRYLQDLPEPGEVVFATGTPISNTLAEAWTMMRYLNEPELRRQGLHHFDAWAKTFGNMEESMELDAAGRYKMTKRFRDFVNKPELARLFQEVADIRVISETPTMQRLRPKLAGGERHIVTSPRDEQLDDYMKVLTHRAQNIPVPPQKGDDNMLKILTDGRKAAIDLRMVEDDGWAGALNVPVGKEAKSYPEGKLVQVARNVARIYETEKPVKGVQLVFLDMGTPKAVQADDDQDDDDDGNTVKDTLTAEEASVQSGIYRVLKERMVDQGIPADQIAFIHDYKSDDAREDLFDEVKKGTMRVVIGSTEKMGVGVNVQDRAAALHHVDAPWRPRDIEQREGRIIRQGNKVYGPILDAEKTPLDPGRGAQVYQYVQKGGLDEFMWQSLEEKGRGIKGIMKRNIDPGERRVQEIDSLVLTAGDTKAAAAANPLVKRNVELGHTIRNMQSDRKAHQVRVKTAQEEVGRLESAIENSRVVLPRMAGDADHVGSLPGDGKFQATISGRSYDKSAEAGEALAGMIKRLPIDTSKAGLRPLGGFKGFEIKGNRLESGYRIVLSRRETGQPYELDFASRDEIVPEGIMRRLNNRITGIPDQAAQLQEKLAASEQRIGSAKEESTLRWDQGEELHQLQQEQAAIQGRLQRGETGESENVTYGLQPSPVAAWTPDEVAAVEWQLENRKRTPISSPIWRKLAALPEPSSEEPAPRLVREPARKEREPAQPAPAPVGIAVKVEEEQIPDAPAAVVTPAELADQIGTGYELAGEAPTAREDYQAAVADIIDRANVRAAEREQQERERKEATAQPMPIPEPEPQPDPEPAPMASPQPDPAPTAEESAQPLPMPFLLLRQEIRKLGGYPPEGADVTLGELEAFRDEMRVKAGLPLVGEPPSEEPTPAARTPRENRRVQREALRAELEGQGVDVPPGLSVKQLMALKEESPIPEDAPKPLTESDVEAEPAPAVESKPVKEAPTAVDKAIRQARRAAGKSQFGGPAADAATAREKYDAEIGRLDEALKDLSDEDLQRLALVPMLRQPGTWEGATGSGAVWAVASRIANEQAQAELDRRRSPVVKEAITSPAQPESIAAPPPPEQTMERIAAQERTAIRREIRQMGGVAPSSATVEELTSILERLKAGDTRGLTRISVVQAPARVSPAPPSEPLEEPDTPKPGPALPSEPLEEPDTPKPGPALPSEGLSPMGLSKEYHARLVAGMAVGSVKDELNKLRIRRESLEYKIRSAESPDEEHRAFWQQELQGTKESLADLEARPAKERRRASTKASMERLGRRIKQGEGILSDMDADESQRKAWRNEINQITAQETELGPELAQAKEQSTKARRIEKAADEVRMAQSRDPEPSVAERVEAAPLPKVEPTKASLPPTPEEALDSWPGDDPVERDLGAQDALHAMSPEVRDTYDALESRLGDVSDSYDRAMLAMKLGADPLPEDVDKAEATLRRSAALTSGQQDMFQATADAPDALVSPEPREAPEVKPAAKRPSRRKKAPAEPEKAPPEIPEVKPAEAPTVVVNVDASPDPVPEAPPECPVEPAAPPECPVEPAEKPKAKAPAKKRTSRVKDTETVEQVAAETAEKVATKVAKEVARETAKEQKSETAKKTGTTASKEKKEPKDFLPPSIRAKTRVGGTVAKPRKPKPAFPKVSVSGGRSSRSKPPPGFSPPRLPGQGRKVGVR